MIDWNLLLAALIAVESGGRVAATGGVGAAMDATINNLQMASGAK